MSDATDEPMAAEDATLLVELGRALGPDLPPEGMLVRAEGLVAFMDVDAELVELLDEAAETVGARGVGGDVRQLSFELDNGSVSIEVVLERDHMVGQVLAGDITEASLEGLDGPTATSAIDDLGRFSLRGNPSGPVRLRLRDGSGRALVTGWFLV